MYKKVWFYISWVLFFFYFFSLTPSTNIWYISSASISYYFCMCLIVWHRSFLTCLWETLSLCILQICLSNLIPEARLLSLLVKILIFWTLFFHQQRWSRSNSVVKAHCCVVFTFTFSKPSLPAFIFSLSFVLGLFLCYLGWPYLHFVRLVFFRMDFPCFFCFFQSLYGVCSIDVFLRA